MSDPPIPPAQHHPPLPLPFPHFLPPPSMARLESLKLSHSSVPTFGVEQCIFQGARARLRHTVGAHFEHDDTGAAAPISNRKLESVSRSWSGNTVHCCVCVCVCVQGSWVSCWDRCEGCARLPATRVLTWFQLASPDHPSISALKCSLQLKTHRPGKPCIPSDEADLNHRQISITALLRCWQLGRQLQRVSLLSSRSISAACTTVALLSKACSSCGCDGQTYQSTRSSSLEY